VNGIAPPLRANGNGYVDNVRRPNGRSGAEGHENGGEGSIQEKAWSWARGFLQEREKEAQKELTRVISGC